jgi:bacterioferritin-associated ferredoxin
MYICLCNGITERQIHDAVKGGVSTFHQLQRELGVATCCGQCSQCAHQVLDEACAAKTSRNGFDEALSFCNAAVAA